MNQIERLERQFAGLSLGEKRNFIEDLQDEMRRSGDQEWITYIQPFISRCIMEYNDEIKRPRAVQETAGYDAGRYPASTSPADQYPPTGRSSPSDDYYATARSAPSGGYPAPAPPVVPVQSPGGAHGTRHFQGTKFDGIMSEITNAVPVAGSTIIFAVGILMVVLSGVNLMSNTGSPVEMFELMDRLMPLRGITWLTSYMLENGLYIFTLVVGAIGITCSMRPEIADKCRVLGAVLVICRILYVIITWVSRRGISRELLDGMSGHVLLSIAHWILPFLFILVAHKVLVTSHSTAE